MKGERPSGPVLPGLVLGMAAGPPAATVACALAGRGWRVMVAADGAGVIAHMATGDPALVLIRGALPVLDGPALAARRARLPPPLGQVPLLVLSGTEPLPTDDVLRRHAVRTTLTAGTGAAPPDPIARLAPMFGAAGIAVLLTRFRDRLAALLAAVDPYAIGEGATAADLAHRLAGIAGTLDFPVLSAAWARVERDGPAQLADAWLETRIARATLDILLDRHAVAQSGGSS